MKKFIVNSILEKLVSRRHLLAYLMFWARALNRIKRPFIIGITGSVGKSTVTAMIAHVLAQAEVQRSRGPMACTANNMNDEMGLSATLLLLDRFDFPYAYSRRLAMLFWLPFRTMRLALSPYPKTFVLEFGAGPESYLRRLVSIASPTISIVTTIAPAHLERMGTIEGVVAEKSILVRATSPTGVAIIGTGHAHVAELATAANCPVIKIAGEGIQLSRNLAHAACRHLGIADHTVSEALASFKRLKGRLNEHRFAGMTVIDDTWNANPMSMQLALDTLAALEVATPSRRVALLGWMAELGEDAERYHQELGAYARNRVDLLIGVGELSRKYQPDFWFESSDACVLQLRDIVRAGDCLLVKGSHSAGMEKVAAELQVIARKDFNQAGSGG